MAIRGDDGLLTGIVLTVVAGLAFAAMDSVGKHLTTLVPVLQVVWARYAVQTVLMTLYLARTSGTRFLRSRRPALQAARGATLLCATFCMYLALARVTLADATSVMFVSPVLVTVLSVVLLGERIGPTRVAAVVAGLAGVLLIIRPGFAAMDPYLLLPLLGALFNAAYFLMTRALAGPAEAPATQFNTTALGTLILTAAVATRWQTPAPGTLALMAVTGVIGTLGHFCLVRALARAPASLLSPFLYSQVLFAAAASLVLFGDPLHLTTILGTAVLIGSGLVIWWREDRRRLAAARA